MKVSLNWIRDYVQLPADADLKKLAYDLTMSTVLRPRDRSRSVTR